MLLRYLEEGSADKSTDEGRELRHASFGACTNPNPTMTLTPTLTLTLALTLAITVTLP